MAKPLAPGALALMEEAVHLLRRAPLTTLVCHFLGAAPFSLALLLFWNDVNNLHTSDTAVARDSLVLALLLAWMNCWRAVFAGRLRRQISASLDNQWNWRRAWNLFAGQAFLGATKLVVFPLALISVAGFAWTVAFYRSATALADRDDMEPVQLMRRARHLAGLDPRQGWLLLPIIFFLQVVFTLNLAATLAFLPQLIRMLTGYESQFSRSGGFFVFNPLFLWATLSVCWMLFDPFTQAVYTLRSFHGESITTGEDVRAGVRRLHGAAALLLALLLPLHSFASVDGAALEQSVRHTVQAPEYDWRIPVRPASGLDTAPWLVRVTDRIIDGLKAIGHFIGRVLEAIWNWIRSLFEVAGGPGKAGALPVKSLHWSLYVLIGVVVLLTAWIAWRRNWFRRPKSNAAAAQLAAIRLDAEDLTADRLPEESWLELAERSLREENFRLALRACYLANLAWLGRIQLLTIHPGKTNREYQREVQRRTRGVAAAPELFGLNIVAFERVWYGMHRAAAEDVAAFRERIAAMKTALAGAQGAAA